MRLKTTKSLDLRPHSYLRAPEVSKTEALDRVITMVKETKLDASELESIESTIASKQTMYDQLFAIEAKAKAEVAKQLDALKSKRHLLAGASTYDGKYLPIAHEVLKWRTDKGLPKLVLFSLNSPTFSITVSSSNAVATRDLGGLVGSGGNGGVLGNLSNQLTQAGLQRQMVQNAYAEQAYMAYTPPDSVSPQYPAELRALYDDVVRSLQSKAYRENKYIRVAATFNGVIPSSTRTKIAEAQKTFKDIFIIAEPELTYEEVQLPIGDPIVAGWDGKQLWFIDDFETTAVEEAALLVGPANK